MISVVVPVYNVEKYIRQCVDSILKQTYTDLEIILVDDGSKDECPYICDQYAQFDSRVKVIHKTNGGLMSAWKEGVYQSKGEYLAFVDSDDWIDADMYERLYEAITKYKADIAICGWIREKTGESELEKIYLQESFYDRVRLEKDIFPRIISFGKMFERYVSPNRVTKLFRREILENNLKYCDERISVGEDMVASFASIFDAQSICVVENFFPYHYRMNEASIMGKPNFDFYNQVILLNNQMRKIIREKGLLNFDVQLNNDLLSMAFWGIERIVNAKVEKKKKLEYISNVVKDSHFKRALKSQTLTQCNKKCKIYTMLLKVRCNYGLYLFISKIVLKKRELFGY